MIRMPLSLSHPVASWAVCNVRRIGLAMMAVSAALSAWSPKPSWRAFPSWEHCSMPRSVSAGSWIA